MSPFLVTVRIIHIGSAVFWAGSILFLALFLEPSLRKAGAQGFRVAQELDRHGFMIAMPGLGLLTIVSGATLYGRLVSLGGAAWARSPIGLTFGIGGLATLVAFGFGVTVLRPAATRLSHLGSASGDAAATAGAIAQTDRDRRQVMIGTRAVAACLVGAIVAMAIARYV